MTSEGEILNDRYRLEVKLGSGGMGSVWRAQDMMLERMVALKELVHLDRSQLSQRRTRAVREARALARVSHPAIVRIHDIFFAGSDPWIVMEHIKGRSLAEIILQGPLTEREIARIGLPVLSGLCAAHAVNVVHRDVKPTNILVTDDNEVFLVDFGIAKISGDMSLTGHSKVLGTPEYLAPEQILGQQVGPAADLWSLGVTFFCAVEGYSPFRREGDRPEWATMNAVLHADLPQPTRPGRLAQVISRLLQRDPSRRGSAAELARALQAIAGEPQRPAPPPSPQPQPRPAPPRQPPPSPRPQPRPQPQPRPRHPPGDRSQETVALDGRARDEAIATADPAAAAARLVALSEHQAAQLLDGVPARQVAAILEAVVMERPLLASALIQMLPSGPASHAVNYLSIETAVMILGQVPPAEAARILARANVRTAAALLMRLPAGATAEVLRAMPAKAAAGILAYVPPLTVATLLIRPGHANGALLAELSPPFRTQVMRHVPRSGCMAGLD